MQQTPPIISKMLAMEPKPFSVWVKQRTHANVLTQADLIGHENGDKHRGDRVTDNALTAYKPCCLRHVQLSDGFYRRQANRQQYGKAA